MTKKAKLASSIVVALFIMALVPIAIFATASKNFQVSNQVKYYVDYLDGKFYYAITGNSEDELNVGYDSLTGSVTPAPLFSADYDNTLGDGTVYDSMNNIIADNSIPVPQTKGLQFDKNHKEISYYFVFINTAIETTPTDDRSVYLKVRSDNTGFDPTIVTGHWEYIIKQTDDLQLYLAGLDLSGTWISETTTPAPFVDGIELEPEEDEYYNYIILRYTLNLIEEKPFSANLNLTITLTSATQE